jgi:hypothetical protein
VTNICKKITLLYSLRFVRTRQIVLKLLSVQGQTEDNKAVIIKNCSFFVKDLDLALINNHFLNMITSYPSRGWKNETLSDFLLKSLYHYHMMGD